MTYHDKIQLTLIIIAPPDQAAEGDRIFQSHGSWMESTHYLPYGRESSPELQRVQGNGALEPDGSQLCADRQHVFRPDRDL
jgi:hypothetical protein